MRSVLHETHEKLGARFVDFSGWEMPVQYTSVLEEHMAVRESSGWFDVSHLGRFAWRGPGAEAALGALLTNSLASIDPGRSQYTLCLNEAGGVIDDIIVWWWDTDDLWVLPNAANHARVMERFAEGFPDVELMDMRPPTVAIAVQGPDAPDVLQRVLGWAPKRFRTATGTFAGEPVWAAGTGYTGERGGEIVLPVGAAAEFVEALGSHGCTPCGLGARDTLRLEAGLPLWGQEMDDTVDPLSAGLGFAVKWDHEFVGRAALEPMRETGAPRTPVAFKTADRRIPRAGMALRSGRANGVVTSGSFSPVLTCGIGMGSLDGPVADVLELEIRGEWLVVEVVEPPFHR